MKMFFKILINQLKNGLFEFITDTLLHSVSEHRRAKSAGKFDLHTKENASTYEANKTTTDNYQTGSHSTGNISNVNDFFNNILKK